MKNEYRTKARNAIIEYLKEHADRRIAARDIVEALARQSEPVDRSTVYRNLERLCREGKLVRYRDAEMDVTCYRYSEGQEACHAHIHAQCENCGKIFHLDNALFAAAEKRMHDEYGIGIDYGKTVITGICDQCKENR